MRDTDDAITIYSDYRCPFCYLGRVSLEQYQAQRSEPLEIDWRPFDLRRHKRGPNGEIDRSIDDGKDEEYYERAHENVLRLQDEYGADDMLTHDDVPDEFDSLEAQLASLYVREEHPDTWRDYDEAIFAALWEEGKDIGDPAVLSDLAADVGLDPAEIQAALDDADMQAQLDEAFEAAHRRGVSSVPTFVYEGRGARGAVPPDELARIVDGEA